MSNRATWFNLFNGLPHEVQFCKTRTECTIKDFPMRNGLEYCKGVMKSQAHLSDLVYCLLVDHLRQERDSRKQLYYTSSERLGHPKTVCTAKRTKKNINKCLYGSTKVTTNQNSFLLIVVNIMCSGRDENV